MGTYKLEKIQPAFWREKKEFQEIWKEVSLRLILDDKDKGGYQVSGFKLGLEIFFKKREHIKKVVLK